MRGSVVLLDFPFGQGGGSKIRPALVVQSDAVGSTNIVVALITSQTHRTGPSRLLVDPAQSAGQGSGLRVSSDVLCEHLFSVDRTRIIRVIGMLSPATMSQIDACLKIALGLS